MKKERGKKRELENEEKENKNRQYRHHNHHHNHHHRIHSRGALFYFPARNFEFLTPIIIIIQRAPRKRRARRPKTSITRRLKNATLSPRAMIATALLRISPCPSSISSKKQRKREKRDIKTYQSFHIRQGLGVILHRGRVEIHQLQLLYRTVLRYDRRRV